MCGSTDILEDEKRKARRLSIGYQLAVTWRSSLRVNDALSNASMNIGHAGLKTRAHSDNVHSLGQHSSALMKIS